MCCASIATILEHFRSYPQKIKKPISSLSLPTSPNPRQLPIYSLYRFAYTGHFIQMESYNIWGFVTGFFYLECFQDSSMLYPVSVHHLFL